MLLWCVFVCSRDDYVYMVECAISDENGWHSFVLFFFWISVSASLFLRPRHRTFWLLCDVIGSIYVCVTCVSFIWLPRCSWSSWWQRHASKCLNGKTAASIWDSRFWHNNGCLTPVVILLLLLLLLLLLCITYTRGQIM